MKKPLWEIRIPTLFALLLIAGSIFLTRYFVVQQTGTVGQASSDTQPQNIYVTDLAHDTFTIAFTTKTESVAGVQVSGSTLPTSVFFQNSSPEARTTHRITIPNLSPSTEYEYVILLEGKTFRDNEEPYRVTTAPLLEDTEINTLPVTGKIINTDGSIGTNVLVTLQSTDSQILSILTNGEGEYIFDISRLKSRDLSKYVDFTRHTTFTIAAYSADLASRATVNYENIFEIPPLTLSQNYDFSVIAPDTPEATSEAQLTIPTPSTIQSTVRITNPVIGESTIDDQPLIKGTAAPRTTVSLFLEPSNLTTTVTTSSTGQWQFRPDSPLPQGKNTITAQAKDSYGVTKAVTHDFLIFPAGSQVAETATPSATLTPTRTPTPTAEPSPTTTVMPSPTVTETVTPTPTVIPTAIPTVIPTATPIPTIQPIITITPTPPGSVSTLLITFGSVILIVTGATLLFILG